MGTWKQDLKFLKESTQSSSFETNDVEEASATITYIGKETRNGFWLLQKIDTSSDTVIRYASSVNNSETTYSSAWTNRASLSYDIFSGVFD